MRTVLSQGRGLFTMWRPKDIGRFFTTKTSSSSATPGPPQTTVPPELDSEFRAFWKQLGWPDGKPPANMINSNDDWRRVHFSPAGLGGEERVRAQAWCRWLWEQGWADTRHEDGNPEEGVWMALPRKWANKLFVARVGSTRVFSAAVPWQRNLKAMEQLPSPEQQRAWLARTADQAESCPSKEFLLRHYAQPRHPQR